jgi:adenylate kinase family enzyme
VTREDDRESVIRERLAEYETQTRPLLEYFRQESVPVVEVIAASATPDEISGRICNGLRSAGLASVQTEANVGVASDAGVRK